MWWRDGFTDTAIYEQDDDPRRPDAWPGPAIVESPADTFAIPPGRSARLDANRVFHLEHEGAEPHGRSSTGPARSSPRGQPIGWDGRTALEMLGESERLFGETGRYWGLDDLDLKGADPIRYEKLF